MNKMELDGTGAQKQKLWYYADAEDRPIGPLPISALQSLAAADVIDSKTLLIGEGDEEWQYYETILRTLQMSPPPLPQAAPLSTTPPLLTATSQSVGFLEKRRVVLPSLILFFPLGLVLLWQSKRFTKNAKLWFTAPFAALGVLALFEKPKLQTDGNSSRSATETLPQNQTSRTAPRQPDPTVSTRESVAYKIASLDAGKPLKPNAPIIGEFRSLLSDVSERSRLPQEDVADQVWAVRKYLVAEKKIQISTLELLRGIHKVVMNTKAEEPFRETLAALATIIFAETQKNPGGDHVDAASSQLIALMKIIER